jgi:hypothetical protein
MIRRTKRLEEFEAKLMRETPADYRANLRIVEAMYEEARLLGVFPLKDPLEGIDVDIRYARAINVRTDS